MNSRVSAKSAGGFLRAFYDKLLAAFVLVALLAALLYLGARLGSLKAQIKDFNGRLDAFAPEHPHAAAANAARYEEAKLRLHEPFQLFDWTNALFVPETRVVCVACQRPIPIEDYKCPFCKAEQPGQPSRDDRDGDGISDKWETENGLNPKDRRDADGDPDGDGFTSLEEYTAGTKPQDAASHPPIEAKLYVEAIKVVPFKLVLKGISTLPDGTPAFQLNTRDNGVTYIKVLGEEADGFLLKRFETNEVSEVKDGGTNVVAQPILILQHKDKEIPLVIGQRKSVDDQIVEFVFKMDGRRFSASLGGTFKLKDREYRLISVDTSKQTVVIEHVFDGVSAEGSAPLEIRRAPRSGT